MAQANDVTVTLSQMDRIWLRQCISNQSKALFRSRSKEVVGSEIYELRGKEIDALVTLAKKF